MQVRHLIRLLTVVSALLLGLGVYFDHNPHASDFRMLGAVGLLAALGEMRLHRLPRSVTAAYELGHTDGYRDGYEEGRRTRPTVIPMRRTEAGSGGHFPAMDRRRLGSAMRTLPDAVESPECAAGGDSAN